MCTVQLGCGVVMMCALWATGVVKAPKVNAKFIKVRTPAPLSALASLLSCSWTSPRALCAPRALKNSPDVQNLRAF